ncbi:hypothetical protein ACN50C_07980 [Levilactobacillus brevis]|mgnify:CR=1|uniref:Uncharacterized protein n=1 Tax=Levilactobacillus brevis TaxID=1580 RepID=A0A378HK93_LEVBR|nr:hypothetical protein [Levilactobacillus brevis]MBS0947836.1 hypothetical protein [Levilactobacillus brevis]MBS0978044.1 hypothetical protein [Levilactobacillus brevis]MBS1006641.1 hypothetical protein [Levilactobacillus brevis]MBS1010981.1 hypothetical protein [Levilactobacillus brevis]MBS1013767.1 hypothetical protein [Levilactobacillus brevis]
MKPETISSLCTGFLFVVFYAFDFPRWFIVSWLVAGLIIMLYFSIRDQQKKGK